MSIRKLRVKVMCFIILGYYIQRNIYYKAEYEPAQYANAFEDNVVSDEVPRQASPWMPRVS